MKRDNEMDFRHSMYILPLIKPHQLLFYLSKLIVSNKKLICGCLISDSSFDLKQIKSILDGYDINDKFTHGFKVTANIQHARKEFWTYLCP